jgi:phasin family protein
MFSSATQLSNATKATIDSHLAAMNEFATKALTTVAEVAELNMATAKASLEHVSAAAQQVLAAKDAQEVLHLASSQAQPSAEKALAYGRQLASIASKTHTELANATEAQVAETSRQVNKLIDDLSKAAPAGSEKAIEMLKASVANTHAAYEQLTKATKHAIETIEESINETTKHLNKTTEKTSRSKKH